MQLEAAPDRSPGRTARGSSGDGGDPAKIATIADIAMYAHGTGELPPGVEGGLDAQAVYARLTSGQAAAGPRRRGSSTSSTTLSAPKSVE